MNEYDEPLDLLDDDGDGVIEMSILEEEQELRKGSVNKNNSSGCSVAFFLIISSVILTGWIVNQIL